MKLSTSKQTYVYKLFYVSLIVNTTQKSTVDSGKMYLQMFCVSLYSRKAYSRFTKDKRRESKHVTIENHQFTKESSRRGRSEQANYKIARKQDFIAYNY